MEYHYRYDLNFLSTWLLLPMCIHSAILILMVSFCVHFPPLNINVYSVVGLFVLMLFLNDEKADILTYEEFFSRYVSLSIQWFQNASLNFLYGSITALDHILGALQLPLIKLILKFLHLEFGCLFGPLWVEGCLGISCPKSKKPTF